MRKSIFFLVMAAVVLLSGCNENDHSTSTTGNPLVNITQFEKYEPEIEIASYYFVYFGNNQENYSRRSSRSFYETFYAAFNLSVHNNGPGKIHFRPGDLHLNGKGVFHPSTINGQSFGELNVREDLQNEKIFDNDTVLLPGQTISGSVIFELEDYDVFMNRSFSLWYNTSPINSASFDKSLTALTEAELFNYSEVFGIPPYSDLDNDIFNPGPGYYYWPNWVNKSVFEYYRWGDSKYLSMADPPKSEISYFIKVVPDRNITIFPGNRLFVVDDTGEEIMNRSTFEGCLREIGSHGQTYDLFPKKVPLMHLSNATIVQFSLSTIYGWGMDMRLSVNNQDIILDDNHAIIIARPDNKHFVS